MLHISEVRTLVGVRHIIARPAQPLLFQAGQTRRVARARVLVSAGGEKKKLAEDVKETNKALAKAGEELQSHLADLQSERDRFSLVSAQQQELWNRQEALFKRETERWDVERAAWSQREALLLSQLSKLQDALVELALAKGSSSASEGTAEYTGPGTGANKNAQQQASNTVASFGGATELAEPGMSSGELQAHQPLGSENSNESARGTAAAQARREPAHSSGSILDEAAEFGLPDSAATRLFTKPTNGALESDESASEPLKQGLLGELNAAFRAVEEADVMSPEFESLAGFQQFMDSNTQTSGQTSSNDLGEKEGEEPPTLAIGSDDIFWVNQLHGALMQASFYPGEEDIEDWMFGEQTLSALLTFQSTQGLPETGIVDAATWAKLLGSNYRRIKPPTDAEGTVPPPEALGTGSADTLQEASVSGVDYVKTLRELSQQQNRDRLAADEASSSTGNSNGSSSTSNGSSASNRNEASLNSKIGGAGAQLQFDKWPVLREGDGGAGVHKLHVALELHGFVADEDDQRWWFFGSSTHSAVMTMQACSGLPESGVVDPRTWLAMLGQDAQPSALESLTSDDYEDDLSGDANEVQDKDAVWLIGEQRWERRGRTA